MNFKDIFVKNLVFLRKHMGLSQQELANIIGFNRSTIAAYEKGNSEPNISKLVTLAQFFKISVDQLISYQMTTKSFADIQHKGGQLPDIQSIDNQIEYYKEKTTRIDQILNSFIAVYEYKKANVKNDIEKVKLLADIDNFIDLITYVINHNKRVLNMS